MKYVSFISISMKLMNIFVQHRIYVPETIVKKLIKKISALMIVKMIILTNMNIIIVVLKNVQKIQKYMKKKNYA